MMSDAVQYYAHVFDHAECLKKTATEMRQIAIEIRSEFFDKKITSLTKTINLLSDGMRRVEKLADKYRVD